MAKNYGKTHHELVEIPAVLNPFSKEDTVLIPPRTYYRQHAADGKRWDETAEAKEGTWFIAVNEDGWIVCCERDPTMVAVVGIDIWQIESDLPREEIFCKWWNGKEVTNAGPA
jgi:hypothetical protein